LATSTLFSSSLLRLHREHRLFGNNPDAGGADIGKVFRKRLLLCLRSRLDRQLRVFDFGIVFQRKLFALFERKQLCRRK
jgi:hypothetical protein